MIFSECVYITKAVSNTSFIFQDVLGFGLGSGVIVIRITLLLLVIVIIVIQITLFLSVVVPVVSGCIIVEVRDVISRVVRKLSPAGANEKGKSYNYLPGFLVHVVQDATSVSPAP